MKKIILEKIAPDPRITLAQYSYIFLSMIGIFGFSALILYLLTLISPFIFSEIFLFSIIFLIIDLIFIFPITRIFQNMNHKSVQNKINMLANDILSKSNITFDKIEYLNDIHTISNDNTYKQFIALDTTNKKILLIDYLEATMYLCDYKNIKSYEILDNTESNSSFTPVLINNRITPIIQPKSHICKILYLVIHLDKSKNQNLIYSIIDGYFGGTNTKSIKYKKCLLSLDRAVSLLSNVIKENKKE